MQNNLHLTIKEKSSSEYHKPKYSINE